MGSSNELDITKVGPVGFRLLQAANELNGGNEGLSEEYLAKKKALQEKHPAISPGIIGIQPDTEVMSPLAGSNVGWGESRYDNLRMANQNQFENLADLRAEQQPWYSKIANGLGKGVILTGTTFLDGTVGLVFGAGTAIAEGRWSGLWDNDFSKAMQAINEKSEELLPNYYTEEEQRLSKERPFSAQNIFSANFIGDKFLKNLGFTVGAFYSGNVAAKAIQATKLPNLIGKAAMAGAGRTFNAAAEAGNTTELSQAINAVGRAVDAPAMVTSIVGTVISAVNEGRIEALNNTKDWYNLEKMKIDDFAAQQADAIDAEYEANKGKELLEVAQPDGRVTYVDPAFVKYQRDKAALQNNYSQALTKLNEDRAKMGNADLLMNLPILIASNAIEFGKLYANGYKTARKGVNVVNRGKYAGKDLSTAWAEAQATGVSMEEFAKEFAQFGAKESRKGIVGGLQRFGKNMMTTALPEGLEEISQKAAATIAGDYFAADVHNFYKAKMDPEATEETVSWAKAFAQGINETINDGSSWEEFFIGALTGALGMPVFGKANTSATDTYLGKGKAVGLRGGIFGQRLADRETEARANTIAEYINRRIQSPGIAGYYQGLTRHNKFQKGMNDAAVEGDQRKFKDDEFAQMVSDIMMFDNAGKIGDLLTIINAAYDVSPENLASIVKNTTAIETNASGEQTLVGPFAQYATTDENGKVAANFGDETQMNEMAEKVTQSRDEMLKTISEYQVDKDEIDILTGQRLTDDQLQELTWIKMQTKNWVDRGTSLAGEVRSVLEHILKQQSDAAENIATAKRSVGAHSTGTKKTINGKEYVDFGPTDLYKELSEGERKILRNVQALHSYLGLDDEDLFLALGSDGNVESVKLLKEAAKDLTTVSPADIDKYNKSLDDIKKLHDAINSFNTKMSEFLANPEKQAAEMSTIKKEAEQKHADVQKNAVARRIKFDAPTAEVAKALAENAKDIAAMGGFDEFIKVLTPEQRKKAQAAQRFSKALDSIKDDIASSDLTDEQKRLANSLLDKEAANAEDIKEVNANIAEAISRGDIEEAISKSVPDEGKGVNDLERLSRIAEAEAKLKEIFESSLKKAADSISALEKTESDRLKKAADAIREEELKEPNEDEGEKGKPLKDRVPEEKEKKEPKDDSNEGLVEPVEHVEGDVTHSSTAAEVKKQKEIQPPRVGTGGPAFYARPQISEFYMRGRNGQTYLEYILANQNEIPGDGSAEFNERYIRYITAVHAYLVANGAFDYVNGTNPDRKLKVGDPIEFRLNPALSASAGTEVVVMITKDPSGAEQVVGTLPTAIDFECKSRGNGDKTVREVRPAQYALYQAVIERSKATPDGKVTEFLESTRFQDEWKPKTSDFNILIHDVERESNGRKISTGNRVQSLFEAIRSLGKLGLISVSEDELFADQEKTKAYQDVLINAVQQLRDLGVNSLSELLSYLQDLSEKEKSSIEASKPITTKVKSLYAGRIDFSDNLERSVATIFESSKDAPVIAVLNDSGTLTTGDDSLDEDLYGFTADSSVAPWSVYVMIPANNGKYLPALCYSAKITDIIDDPNDWYVKQIIQAIQKIPSSIADLKDNIKAVYKWLPIPGLSIGIGHKGANGRFIKETADVSQATHVRVSYTDPKNAEGNPIFFDLEISDGKIDAAQIRSKLADSIRKHVPALTTNVDIKRLTDRPADQEYRKNISKYLYTNVTKPHTVNDFFTYELTDIEADVAKKDRKEKREEKKGTPKKEEKGRATIVELDGNVYQVRGTDVTDADDNPVSEETKAKVLAALTKPADAPAVPIQPIKTDVEEHPDKAFAAINMGGTLKVKVGTREAKGSRWGKKLAVTDTDDEIGTEEQIYQNAEKVRQMLPQLSRQGRIIVVNGLIKTVDAAGNPIEAYGEFRDGVLYISSQSPSGTAFHEAFHYVTDMLMEEQERMTMFEAAREQYGEMPEMALEEKLAESFRDYVNGYEDKSLLGRIKTFFRNLKHVIDGLTGRLTYLDSLFYNIYRGRYGDRQERFETSEEQRILREAPRDIFYDRLVSYKSEQLAYNNLDDETKQSLKDKGVSQKEYDALTVEGKESILFCLL